jgi:hypothetical protein
MNMRPLLLLLATLLFGTNAYADRPGFGDTWSFKVGGMSQTANLAFSSTREGRPDIELDLTDLDMDDNASTVWAGVTWQFAENWGTTLSYSGFSTDGEAVADEDGNFGDIEWSAAARLSSSYDLDLYVWDVHWDFINNERTNVRFGLGLHIADVSLGVGFELDGLVNGQPVVIDSGAETADVTAPLPNVLLGAGHRFGENFYLTLTGGYFALEIDKIDGELIAMRGALEWRPWEQFGFGLGYQYLDVNFTETEDDRKVKFDMDAHGPVLFLSVGF